MPLFPNGEKPNKHVITSFEAWDRPWASWYGRTSKGLMPQAANSRRIRCEWLSHCLRYCTVGDDVPPPYVRQKQVIFLTCQHVTLRMQLLLYTILSKKLKGILYIFRKPITLSPKESTTLSAKRLLWDFGFHLKGRSGVSSKKPPKQKGINVGCNVCYQLIIVISSSILW